MTVKWALWSLWFSFAVSTLFLAYRITVLEWHVDDVQRLCSINTQAIMAHNDMMKIMTERMIQFEEINGGRR